ncbi:MAG TPA: MotA/TolQ/ExbB proton channel family protein [Kofleriaceae bacterium]|jgi:biopolymer transport protein ExbB
MEQSILDILGQGYGAMGIVVAFSVMALTVAIERAIAQWKFVTRARNLGETVTRCLARGAFDEGRSACERSQSPVADVFLVGYERLGRAKPEHVATAVHRERQRVNQDLRARLWVLGTVGATAPFVGLFGTVVGIMKAMGGFKGDEEVKFTTVSGPISEALIVTAVGIGVAVGSVILFNFFSQRASRIAIEMKLLTDEFLELLLETPGETQPSRKARLDDRDIAHDDGERDKTKRTKGDNDGDREAA